MRYSELIEQVARWRWVATDALPAVGTDVVIARQCSQCLVEQTSEKMAVGVDAVPPSVAATSLAVLPHTTTSDRTARKGARHGSKGWQTHATLTARR